MYTSEFASITAAVTMNVIGEAFAFPAMYALTLGIVGPLGIIAQVPVNETFTHLGNSFFAISCGLLVTYTSDGLSIFWICIVMRIVSSIA